MLLQEFKKRFVRLSALNRIVLDKSKVLLFIKSIDPLDQEKVGLLLETDEGLTTDWAMVKRVCSRFDKQREWNEEGSTSTTRGLMGEGATRSGEAKRRADLGPIPTNVVEGPSGGATLEELTKMVHDLHIDQARRDGEGQLRDRYPPNGLRCMWCNGVNHIWRDCTDFAEALRNNVVYRWNGRVYVSEM